MKTHKDAIVDMQRRVDALQRIDGEFVPLLARDVAGHAGDSAVTVTSRGRGATVEVRGPDAAEQRRAVAAKARKASGVALRELT